jgi:[NiFe] hydrogenase assembly HybE family chaperone
MSDSALLPDPSARLAEAYRGVQKHMEGLGFLNPALSVETVAFAPWEGRWLGVLVTPWSINLALAPCDPSAWRAVGRGDKIRYAFPAGEYEFIGATDDVVGELQVCSLFSPVQQFEDQATARLVATLAREALFDPQHAKTPDPTEGPALSPPGPVAKIARNIDAPMSRRDLFRGRFLGPSHDDRG